MSAPSRRLRFTLDASSLAVLYTYLAFSAFFSALIIGSVLHYKKIVKNGVAGYPQEWFPSVSATIGDWYPERNIFQILIAVNSGPRFALVLLQYYLHRSSASVLPGILCCVGIIRTLSCGGFVYITSSDDHDVHDVLMITYIVCNIPWMFGGIKCTPVQNTVARRRRKLYASVFFISIIPMIYFFIQHKVHRVPGAYTHYSFFEWSLIILDILYDSVAKLDFANANLQLSVGMSLTSGSISGYNDIVSETANTPAVAEAQKRVTPPAVAATTITEKKDQPAKPAVVPKQIPLLVSLKFAIFQFEPILNFLSDVYLSYIQWSVFTSLTPTLFYFSVWELGLAGSELSLLSTLSPIVLNISPVVVDLMCSRVGRTVLYGLTSIGLAAYALPTPLQRLLAVAFANMACCIGFAVDWSGPVKSVGYQATLVGLGLFLTSLSKHANHSVNPVWPIVHEGSGGYNKTGIILTFLAIYNYYHRCQSSLSTPSIVVPESARKETKNEDTEPIAVRTSWIADSLALGSLIFSLHSLLGDSSTLITWTWTGYPIKGPVPHLHGSLTHIAQIIGLLLPLIFSNSQTTSSFLSHPLWFAYGCASAYVVGIYSDWIGYIGGLNLSVFLMSIIPLVLLRSATSSGNVGKLYSLAMLVVALFDVASVFTAAYAFVPGGEIFRERINWVLAVQMVFIGLAFNWPRISSNAPTLTLPPVVKTYTKNALAIFSVLSLLVTMYRWPTKIPQPYRPGPRILRAGIWTVHFGIDNEGRDSQRRMRDLIRDMELDVVGLLETDLHRVVFGNRDLTRVMVDDLGFYVDIGPGPNKHTWGAVLLSKFPIINSTHHLLPSPDGELAPAIHAVLDVFGTPVNVIVAHNGQEETPLDRELQSTELARIMSEVYPQPLIFLGYVVTKPHAARPAPYDIMVTDGRVHDIDKDDFDRWCQYIFYRGLYRTSYVRVSRSTITDTELQIGEFALPKHGSNIVDDSEEARYRRAWKEELPDDHWFPMEYYPQNGGVRGHEYHVFNTPLYYKLPEGVDL
ncbi:Frag1/DRAM/Sfk1 family-domain-containing protein [Abortiporus biennis]|nr:Frag1/DRAM/Sfk1 family-domain-containing protein [Abortiporus biennis]